MTVAVRGLGFVVDDAYEAGDTISIRAHRVKDLPETGNNFSEQLAISRPVISKTIADLETLVGVRLLHALGAFGLIRAPLVLPPPGSARPPAGDANDRGEKDAERIYDRGAWSLWHGFLWHGFVLKR